MGYPGNPGTVVPAVWLSRWRSVTGVVRVCSLSGNRHDVSCSLTSRSRSRSPCSTNAMTPTAATALLIEAAWNNVDAVTGAPPVPVEPYSAVHSMVPSETTAHAAPGTW